MDRDEFMELVYETFADEPDNVLANGIIEAADAYVEHEKAQLSKEGTTSDLISRTETVERLRRVLDATVPITDYDSGYVDGVEFGVSTVSTMPTVQPQSTTGQLNDSAQSTDLIDRQAALNALMDAVKSVGVLDADDIKTVFDMLPTIQPVATDTNVWNNSEIPNSSDAVSRQAAVDVLHGYFDGMLDTDTVCPADIYGLFECIPSAQPERKNGEWSDGYRWQRCSLCKQTGKKSWNYCPNCGAKMKGVRHETD